jgi:hypothetical protein
MTFEEFQATKFLSLDLEAALQQDLDCVAPVAGYVYCGSLFIERNKHDPVKGDEWHLLIGNMTELGTDLEAFERRLFEYALSEEYSLPTAEEQSGQEIEMLTREYTAWNSRNGLKLGSADDHLFDESLTQEQRQWVNDFSQRWDDSTMVGSSKGAGPGRFFR